MPTKKDTPSKSASKTDSKTSSTASKSKTKSATNTVKKVIKDTAQAKLATTATKAVKALSANQSTTKRSKSSAVAASAVTKAAKSQSSKDMVYQLKIILQDSDPPIWRRVLVSPESTFGQLHHIIQHVMEWKSCHTHAFRMPPEKTSDLLPNSDCVIVNPVEYGEDENYLDEDEYTLNEILKKTENTILYEYDLGDHWIHQIILEKILPRDPDMQLPVCLEGERAAPPEEIKGIGAYEAILAVLADANHLDYKETVECHGDIIKKQGWDDFDEAKIKDINHCLMSLSKS